ncbi:MAG: tetratricopeptide repeat protein [Alistipes sp.]|nr:tetratricopeptide repeat protein [Alistipes sp.]
MQKPTLNPTENQTFEIIGSGDCDFVRTLEASRRAEREQDVERACNIRYAAFGRIAGLLPDDEETILEWNHRNTRAAMETIYASAVDHFLIDDFEMSAAMLELLLDVDPEDHLESVIMLAMDYVALEEYELLDEIINDISDKYAVRALLLLWSSFRRTGELPAGEVTGFRKRFPLFFAEFTAAEHPADEKYLADIESEHPSQAAQARELWLQTENLWRRFPGFVERLQAEL